MKKLHCDVHLGLWDGLLAARDCRATCGMCEECQDERHRLTVWPVWLDEVWPDYDDYAPTPHTSPYIWQ